MKKRIKKICSFFLAGVICLGMTQAVWAHDVPDMMKIGLESVCKNVRTATINTTDLTIGTLANDRFQEHGNIKATNGFTVTAIQGELVQLSETFAKNEAENLASAMQNMGCKASLGYLGNDDWTVYIQNSAVSEVEQKSNKRAERVTGFVGVGLQDGNQTALIVRDTVAYAFGGTGKENTFSINGKTYRGYLTFAQKAGALTAVNVVDLEEYIYGVVPAEMPVSYGLEALKAQALAARTYALTKIYAHKNNGYELCDTIHCQVYKGYGFENATSNKAVDDTEGMVIYHNGTPIEAVFSASTGGYTENSENVWNTEVPYLRAVPELAEYTNNPWTKTVTLSELDNLTKRQGNDIGTVQDIVITKLSTGGRVQEMKIVGSTGEKVLTKENIRTYFSPVCGSLPSKMFTINGKGGQIGVYDGKYEGDAPQPTTPTKPTEPTEPTQPIQKQNSLTEAAQNGIVAKTEGTLSAMNGKTIGKTENRGLTHAASDAYTVYDVNISTVENGKFVFAGVGNGHGVGLSQNGAKGMADMGYTYDQIIKHYYTGVTIER